VAKEIRERLASGDMGIAKDKAPALLEYGNKILNSPLNSWTTSTLAEYKGAFRIHLKPTLGHRTLDTIKKRHVKELLTQLRSKGLSASRVETVLGVLRAIFNHAVEDEHVPASPCDKMSKYCGQRSRKVNPLDVEEVQQLVEGASHLPLVLNTFFLVKVRTGLRIGEIAALEWSDVNLEDRTIDINKQRDLKRKETRPPKKGSERVVRLTPQATELLKELYESGDGVGLVFAGEGGKYLTYKKIQLALERIAPKPMSPHDLRHTYATLRIAKGDNIVDVSKQLGHKNIKITLDVYTHWVPSAEYVQQVDELDTLHLTAPPLHPGESADAVLH
jgi:integrase